MRIDSGSPATVIVGLPPQHIAEASTPTGSVPGFPPLASAAAGGSQLAFTVPDGVASLPLDLPTLLGWASLVPVPPAHPAGTPGLPGASVLELPYRMLLAVDAAQWQHPTAAVFDPATGAAELWRTRAIAPSLHVAYSHDLDSPPPPPPPGGPAALPPPNVPGPLTADVRSQIARQAPPLDVDVLTLSALGATTNLHASLAASDVSDWHHVMSLGRDSYVRVVLRGYTCALPFPVAVVTVAERIPVTSAADGALPPVPLEGLVSTTRIVFTSPVVDFTDAEATAAYSASHPMMSIPLRKVSMPDPVTPPVTVQPGDFVRDPQNEPFIFHVVAEDLSGASVELSLPLVFLESSQAHSADTIYNGLNAAPAELAGQDVVFVGAPGPARTVPAPGDGSLLPVDTMSFTVFVTGGQNHPFLPQLDQAVIRVPAASAVAGGPAEPWTITYHPAYLSGGIDPATNRGTVFAAVTGSPTLALGAGSVGGLAAPQLPIDGLSRTLGPVAGAQSPTGDGPGPLMTGQFDPATLLAPLKNAVLLGGIPLSAILAPIAADDFDPSKVPAFVRSRLTNPDRVETTFTWAPPIRTILTLPPGSQASPPILAIDAGQAAFSLSVKVDAPLDGSPPSSEIDGQLNAITLTFVGAVELSVDQLVFHARIGHKVDFTTGPDLKISFTGDLWFLNVLANVLPPDGFADPPYVDADAQGVTAGYTLALPSIGIGIVSVQNIAFEAALSLSFTAPLGLRLAFSTREHPFIVSVSFIGGGGFFGIDVGADGIHLIEGALELGADLSVDLAIVSAEVHVLAGFYFGIDTTGTTFSAFLRIGGEVDLLGLISVSIELYLELTYTTDRSQIGGTASLTLSIHVLFTTASVTLSVEKHFDVPGGVAPGQNAPAAAIAAAPAPPSPIGFSDVMSLDDWVLYLGAFA